MKKLGIMLIVSGILLVIVGASVKSDGLSGVVSAVMKKFKPKPVGTPFVPGSWEIPPFTNNDNRVAPLLWSIKFHIPKKPGCVSDAVGKMYVTPGTVVFIKVVDESEGSVKVGTVSDKRTITDTGAWLAARFVTPNKRSAMDIPITKREQFIICDATENMVVHFEARKLPKE